MSKMCMRCGHTALDIEEKCPLCGVDFNEVEPEKIGRIPNFGKKRKLQREYEKNESYYRQWVIPYLTNETTFIKISHWHFMPEDLHRERMEAIKNKTIWGKFVVNSSLRVNPRIPNSHEEFYELRLPKAKDIGPSQFKELYKNCCVHLGFDHMM